MEKKGLLSNKRSDFIYIWKHRIKQSEMGLFLHLIVVMDLFLTSALVRDHGIIISTEHLAGMGFWGSQTRKLLYNIPALKQESVIFFL